VYEPSRRHLEVSLPQREHGLLAEVLISALGSPDASGARDAAVVAARERGEREGAAVRERVRPGRLGVERATRLTSDLLSEHGFEPVHTDGEQLLRLRNCPFHPLVASSPELVCGLNHAYLCGMLHGLGADTALDAVLAPEPGQCCVAFRRRENT
jgi:predicted ArsR family transcriptional regulator